MGAQVYNQMIQRVHQSPAPPRMKMSMRPAASSVNSFKRNLFGKVDTVALKKFVDQELKEHSEAKSKKWGFDFSAGRPVENSSYEWQSVQAEKAPVAPAMITLTQAAHVIPTSSLTSRRSGLIRRSNSSSSQPLSMVDLMDEWAKRANTSTSDSVDDGLNHSLSTTSTLSSPTVTGSEESESESVETYPTPTSSARVIRKLLRESPRRVTSMSPPRLRQAQITEFLKERKRLSSSKAASVERVSARKVRLMMADSSSGADAASTSSSLN